MCSTMAKDTRVTVGLGDYNENVRRLVRRDRGSCEVFGLEQYEHFFENINGVHTCIIQFQFSALLQAEQHCHEGSQPLPFPTPLPSLMCPCAISM